MSAVVVTLPDTPTITASASTVCQGTNAVFRISSPVTGATYTWSVNPASPAGTVSGTGNGTYTVSGATTGTKSVSAYAHFTSSGTTCQSNTSGTVSAVVAAMPAAATITTSASTVCQGTNVVFRISSPVTGATYTWSVNPASPAGTVSGTGDRSYTVSGATTGTKSVTAYARLTSSGTTCQSNTSATVSAVVATMPDVPKITASASTVCKGTNAVFTASGTTGATYTWSSGGTASGTGNGTYTVSGATTGTKSVTAYARFTSSGTTCQSANAATVTLTVNPVPIIYRSGGNVSQSVNQYVAITAMTYTADNSATFTRNGTTFPSGLYGVSSGSSHTIYGAPTVAGTFGYSLTAAVGGCTSDASVGTITVNAGPLPSNAASTKTWTYGSLTWSDVINVPACDHPEVPSDEDNPYCRSYIANGTKRYYYNWSYVVTNANLLCPTPWGVPNRAQYNALITAIGYNGTPALVEAWGTGGRAVGGGSIIRETNVEYWTSERYGATAAYEFLLISPYDMGDRGTPTLNKSYGLQVRCVQ
jgi:hypothetical protein